MRITRIDLAGDNGAMATVQRKPGSRTVTASLLTPEERIEISAKAGQDAKKKQRKSSGLDAAAQVLAEAGEPLDTRTMVERSWPRACGPPAARRLRPPSTPRSSGRSPSRATRRGSARPSAGSLSWPSNPPIIYSPPLTPRSQRPGFSWPSLFPRLAQAIGRWRRLGKATLTCGRRWISRLSQLRPAISSSSPRTGSSSVAG